jgi:dipeptidyl-peptidase-4
LSTLALAGAVASPEAAPLQETLRQIFEARSFEAKRFGPARWIDEGAGYTTLEASAETPGAKDLIRYDTASGARRVLVAAAQLVPAGADKPLVIEDYAWSKDGARLLLFTHSAKVWRLNTRGDYFVFDLATRRLRQLGAGAPASSLMFAKFSPDGGRVAYVRENNLYVEDVASGAVTPLTTDGSATVINGTSDWAYEEEFALRDGFRWSADGRRIAYWRFDTTGVGEFDLIDNTAGLYPVIHRIPYPKVGTTNSAVRIGVVAAAGGEARFMEVPGDPRNTYIPRMEWASGSDQLVLQQLNRLQNRNDLWLADAASGAVHAVFHDEDEAWVDVQDTFQWLDDGRRLLWLSEREGWRRPYAVSRDGATIAPLTTTAADVMRLVAVDPARQWMYFIASPEDPTRRLLYRASLEGASTFERLTPTEARGSHSYQISPDCRWAFHTYSTFDAPPVVELVRLPSHEVVRVLEDNHELRAKLAPVLDARAEFFRVTVGEDVTLDGWMITPPDFDPRKSYPVLTYVYGEPAGTTVVDGWPGEVGLFHRALAREGYIVVSFDNRGTPAPKGRAWRKVVYGAVGVLSAREQAEAIQAFARTRPYVDLGRAAIWGWSGGGSNTLNVMFRSPGLYQAGISVAPVADQRYYDTIYQERYMGLPDRNAEGYRAGSPISFAEGLAGKLLLVHGSGDDNCHIQATELLVNRLIALGKAFDYFVYPGRTHGISEGAGTSLHLYQMIARYLEEHVPRAPRVLAGAAAG